MLLCPQSQRPQLFRLASSTASSSPMAHHHHSPSPSGCTSRRLSELLGEQQEPFYLDLYLLEKGCSPAFLDAAACGRGGACSTCWPRARGNSGRLRRWPAARRNNKGRGVLRLLLSKILSGATTATAPAAAVKKKKKRRQPAAIGWRRADVDHEKPRPEPGRSEEDAAPSTAPRAVERQRRVEVDEEREEEDDDGEDEEDESSSKKQLSPVSVLEQRLFEHSPPPPHAQKAFVLFSELLEAACTPTTLVSLLATAKQLRSSRNNNNPNDGRSSTTTDGSSSTPTTTRRRRRNSKNNHHARRDADDDTFESDLAAATALVSSELGGARVRPADVVPEREDVAGDVAAAVLDALTEEAAAELMTGTMDHRGWYCAAGTAATATSVVGFRVGR